MFNCNKAKLVVTLGKLSWLAVNTKFYKLMFRFVSLPNSAQTRAVAFFISERKQQTNHSTPKVTTGLIAHQFFIPCMPWGEPP